MEGRQLHVALPRDVCVTAYQWQRLYAIRAGEIQIYGENVDKSRWPGVVRAVGRACATNPVSLVVPCHRAVGADGRLTGYRWGVERKKALLEREKKPSISINRRR